MTFGPESTTTGTGVTADILAALTLDPPLTAENQVLSETSGYPITEIVAVTNAMNLTAAQCRGSIITNYGQSGVVAVNLPAAAAGLSFKGRVITAGTDAWSFKPQSGEQVVLDGVLLDANHKVSIATPGLGNTFVAICHQIGATSYRWFFDGSTGVYSDGAE